MDNNPDININNDELEPVQELNSTLVSESIKNGHNTNAGSEFEKVWVIKNNGSKPWPNDTKLTRTWGDNIQAAASFIGEVKPETSTNIKLLIKAPLKSGHCYTHYDLTYDNSKNFGEPIWIDFIVS